MDAPLISVLIPTWNGQGDLEKLLPALQAQAVFGGYELVALDSESSDGTLELLKEHGARVESVAQKDFAHGRARNRLAEMAKGRYLVFLSQDAVPLKSDFLRTLTAPLEDERLAGTWARNLPGEADDALTRRTLLTSVEASPSSVRVQLEPGETLADMSPQVRVAKTRFNNVASAMARTTWQNHPFPDVPFGEDSAWAARVLSAGLGVQFVAEATVVHAHRYGPRSAFLRYRQDARFLREVHGLVVRPSLWSVLRGIAFEVREDWRYLARHGGRLGDWFRSPALRTGQVLGQWRGSRIG